MDNPYAPPQSPVRAVIKERLIHDAAFEVEEHAGDRLLLKRRRRVPRSGLLRLFVPWLVVRVRQRGAAVTTAIRPDPLAWFMLVMLTGGLIVELRMDRVTYPRDYPPAFVFGLAFIYTALVLFEFMATRRALRRALADP